jgi:DNA replication and repair protein RecF
MQVTRAALTDFRNYEHAETALTPGLTVVHGAVGAGKTSFLEAVYFGCVGRSCRTTNDREVVRFGSQAAKVRLLGSNGAGSHELEVVLQPGSAKRFTVDGVSRDGFTQRPLVCVFLPDRLELVKGPAATRRAHLDAFVKALWPARHETRAAYGRALVQRNALLARSRSAQLPGLAGWNRELARHGLALTNDRARAIEQLGRSFGEHADALGLAGPASLRYRPRARAETIELYEQELEATIAADIERGYTTFGPHRDELVVEAGGRELRRFGSQGQQRLGLLALLLSERDALFEATGDPPLLLLDDVLSELDPERRGRLLEAVRSGGQTIVTTADPTLAVMPDAASLRVEAGRIDG